MSALSPMTVTSIHMFRKCEMVFSVVNEKCNRVFAEVISEAYWQNILAAGTNRIASSILRGVVNKSVSFNRRRLGTRLRPTFRLYIIFLIKNALRLDTLHALYNKIIDVEWRHPKIAFFGPSSQFRASISVLVGDFQKVEINNTGW